ALETGPAFAGVWSKDLMDIHVFWLIASFLVGAVVGSFLNVVIARLPIEESIVLPGSRCPNCRRGIKFYDNIPIVSWIILGGRCRYCGCRISLRYPLVELVTALLFMVLYLKWGLTPTTGVLCGFVCAMIAIFWIDLDHMIIPDAISLNFIPVGVAASVVGVLPGMDWKTSLLGLVLGLVVSYVPALIYEKLRGIEGLGGGDVKLLAMIGAFTGPYGVVFVLFLSSVGGTLVAVLGMFLQRAGSTTPIPFGPFLTLAALAYVFAGDEIIEHFLRLARFF
ncbi:MAG: prepilin peptidase, partial [Desulfomonile sp.]|nr:prepilin peptidase [Desulfomonile sp.]